MRVPTGRLRIFLCVTAPALLVASTLVPLSQPARAQFRVADQPKAQTAQDPDVTSPATIQALLNSTELVTGNFELQSAPVVLHERSVQPAEMHAKRVDVASAEAQNYESILVGQQRSFEAQAAAIYPGLNIVAELRKLVNMVSIKAPGNQVAKMAALPGLKHFQLGRKLHALLDKSVPLINAPALWAQLGGSSVAGKGIKIAIVDTGIDITNPLFSDAGFKAPAGFPMGDTAFTNNKVISAKAFVEDASTPEDQFGHGTNVAGIAAGDLNTPTPLGPISGVAPAAFLGNYRVLDASGSGQDSLIALGLETAFLDGFDVANLSLGGTATDPPDSDPSYEAVQAAVSAGMVVAVAAGNEGPGEMTIDSPGTAPLAITCGASSNAHLVGPALTVNGPGVVPADLVNIESTLGSTCAPESFPIGPLVVFDESEDGQILGCKKVAAGSLKGGIALIERGTCTFVKKINDATDAGAVAAIVYNADLTVDPDDGGDNLIIMEATGTTIPSVFIGRTNGLALQVWVDSNPSATATISGVGDFPEQADVLASFSSEGPTLDEVLKPDLCGPGVNIYSGALTSLEACTEGGVYDPSGFLAISGTSMATPHIAGSSALLLQLNPNWTPAQIKSALVSSADMSVVTAVGSTTTAGVLAAGAGRVDLASASAVSATMSPSSLSFGHSKAKATLSLTQTLNITSVLAGQTILNISIEPLTVVSGVTVTSSQSSLMLTKGQTGSVQIIIASSDKKAQKGDQTGFVVITSGTGPTLRVPFWVRF